MLHRTVATATRPHAQVHNNTLCHMAATATRPCAQAHDNTSHRTAATTTRTGATKMTKLLMKPCIHVASHGGNNDNNSGDKVAKVVNKASHSHRVARWQQQQQLRQWWRQMSTTRPRARAHSIFISRRAKAMTTTTIGNNEWQVLDDKALYASTPHISHCAQAHMLRVKHRRNKQPGNVKLRCARATSSNIDNLVCKCTRLSSFVHKCTSYSIKHRCNNQPFQRQA